MSLVLSTISLFSFTWVHQLRGVEWPTSDPPYYSTLACAVEKSLQLCFKAWKKMGSSSLQVIGHRSIWNICTVITGLEELQNISDAISPQLFLTSY